MEERTELQSMFIGKVLKPASKIVGSFFLDNIFLFVNVVCKRFKPQPKLGRLNHGYHA